jgi:hypothetical protein
MSIPELEARAAAAFARWRRRNSLPPEHEQEWNSVDTMAMVKFLPDAEVCPDPLIRPPAQRMLSVRLLKEIFEGNVL